MNTAVILAAGMGIKTQPDCWNSSQRPFENRRLSFAGTLHKYVKKTWDQENLYCNRTSI